MPKPAAQSLGPSTPIQDGDGFTAEEVQSALQHSKSSTPIRWIPTIDYEELDIGELVPGPHKLTLMGRIVNFYNVSKPSKQHRSAQGYLKIQLADDTGVITIRLWYANTVYDLRLGQMASLWTVHVSNSSEHNTLAPDTAPLFTSIFPEGERNCHFMIHENSDDGTRYKRPFGCCDTQTLPGLMTLRNYTDGGYDVKDVKVLVCVKSIGAKKQYINRNGTTSQLTSLAIFDDTADASLTLYSDLCASASSFHPNKTIFLISNPGWRIETIAKLSLNANSRIDIDPDIPDARRLRALAYRLTKKQHVNPPFPAFDVDAAQNAAVRVLFRFADIDEFARRNATEEISGYISVVITQLNIVMPFKRNMLMCNECCGVPVYANAIQEKCTQCGKHVELRVNPCILGPIIDETGEISSGKLILSDTAWEQLLGRTSHQLVSTNVDVFEYLEQRLLLLRVTMGFVVGLEEGIGRVAVWCVRN